MTHILNTIWNTKGTLSLVFAKKTSDLINCKLAKKTSDQKGLASRDLRKLRV